MSRVGVFTAAYVTAFVAFAAARGDRRIAAYLLVAGSSATVLWLVHRRVSLPNPMLWALALCGLLHLSGGLLPGDPVLYNTWLVPHVLRYDQLVHFTITATLTVTAARATGTVAGGVAVALVAGLGNEVFELLSALQFADAHVGDRTNAAWDLVFNVFGSATAASVLLARSPARSD